MGDPFAGRIYVVTGCSKGIGKYLTKELIDKGAVVHGVARTKKALEALKQDFRDQFTFTACDLATEDCVDRVVSDVSGLHGTPYGLINNAGAGAYGDPLQLGYETYEKLTRLLYLAPVKLTLSLAPKMIEKGEGVIVNVITLGIASHIKGLEAYLAPKHALHRFTRDLRDYLNPKGIRVIAVYPGVTKTDFFKGQGLSEFLNEMLKNPITKAATAEPEDVAKAIIKAIEKGKERITVPSFSKVLLIKT